MSRLLLLALALWIALPWQAEIDLKSLREGGYILFRPQGDSFAIVGRIRVQDWQAVQ